MNFLFNINVCRVCMQNDQSCNLSTDNDLLEKFEFTTRLTITDKDNLPKAICTKCKTRLKVAYTFIKTAHESEKNLKTFLAKISTEFQEVSQGSKCTNKPTNEQINEDDVISSLLDDNCDDIQSDTDFNEKSNKLIIPDKNTKKPHILLEVKKLNNTKVDQKIKEDALDNSKKDETIYQLHKDILLIQANNEEIDSNDYGSNTHFMEIPPGNNEEEMDKVCYSDGDQENEKFKKSYDCINMVVVNARPDVSLKKTELTLGESEENQDYKTVAIIEDDEIQYQSIYIDESSIETVNKKNDNHYINNINEEEIKDLENQRNSDADNDHNSSDEKTFFKKERVLHRFYCDKCNRDFSTKTNLNRHMQSHEGNKPFSCAECSKSFTQKSTLKQHMYTHTGERPYVCEICNRGFTQCKSLIFHMRRHTGEKPFHCEYCLITFRQKDALRIHIIKHHVVIAQGIDGSEVFTCIICQTKFNTKSDFKVHMKVHTAPAEVDNVEFLISEQDLPPTKKTKRINYTNESEVLEPVESEYIDAAVVNVSASSAAEPSRAKKFQCRKCFKCFALKKSLMRHVRIHYFNKDDNDIAECFECELQFPSTEMYQEHLSEYHQYACSDCPELVFKSIQDLKMHMFEHELDQKKD